jgi:hypothetical protein
MKQLPVNTATGSIKPTRLSVSGIGSNRIVLMLFLLLLVAPVKSQNYSALSVGFNYAATNFNQYPVAFSTAKVKPPSDALGFLIESIHIKNRHVLGVNFSFNYGLLMKDNGDSIKSGFSSQSIMIGYGQQFKLGKRGFLKPMIFAGIQYAYVTFTNQNNNSLQAISSGNTNEISLISANPNLHFEVEYVLTMEKKGAIGFYSAYQNGIFKTPIENLSGARVPNAKFNPTAFMFGIKFYPRYFRSKE